MEFSYELSEKAAPFLRNCDLEDQDICKEFQNEAFKQWEIIKEENTGKITKLEIIKEEKTGKMTNDDENGSPYTDMIRFYLEAYHDYQLAKVHKNVEDLDFDMFMEFANDLSEKAEPFFKICEIARWGRAFDFDNEVQQQWELIIEERGKYESFEVFQQ